MQIAEDYFFLQQFEHCFAYASLALIQACNSPISPITILGALSFSKTSNTNFMNASSTKNIHLNYSILLQYLKTIQVDITDKLSQTPFASILLLLLKSSYLMRNKELTTSILETVVQQGNTTPTTKLLRQDFLLWILESSTPLHTSIVENLLSIWKQDISEDARNKIETKLQNAIQQEVEQSTLEQLKQKERREKYQNSNTSRTNFVEEYDYDMSHHQQEMESHWPGTGNISHHAQKNTSPRHSTHASTNNTNKPSTSELYKIGQFVSRIVSQPLFWYSLIGSFCFVVGFAMPQETKMNIKNQIVQFFSMAFSIQ